MTTSASRQREAPTMVILAVGNLLAAVLAWIGYAQTRNALTGACAAFFTLTAIFCAVRYAKLRSAPTSG